MNYSSHEPSNPRDADVSALSAMLISCEFVIDTYPGMSIFVEGHPRHI